MELQKTETSVTATSLRRKKRAEKIGLGLLQVFVSVFRAIARVAELGGSPKRQRRLRQFRERMNSLDRDKQQLFRQIQSGDVRGGLEELDAMLLRYARPEERTELEERQLKSKEMWQELDALKAIASQAGENKRLAVEGYQEYVKLHPDSSRGYSYLAGFLKKVGDPSGSLRAYQEALRLVDENSLEGTMVRLNIGKVHLDTGSIEAAIQEFQFIIDHVAPQTRTTVCMAYLTLGDAHVRDADKGKAKEAWKMAIQWDETKTFAKQAQERLKTL